MKIWPKVHNSSDFCRNVNMCKNDNIHINLSFHRNIQIRSWNTLEQLSLDRRIRISQSRRPVWLPYWEMKLFHFHQNSQNSQHAKITLLSNKNIFLCSRGVREYVLAHEIIILDWFSSCKKFQILMNLSNLVVFTAMNCGN